MRPPHMIAHFMGWAILWIIGAFVVPAILAIIALFITLFDSDKAVATFWVTLVLYFIGTGVVLILS